MMKLESIKKSLPSNKKTKSFEHWDDILVQNYYSHYFQNISSKDLDRDFNNDIRILTQALKKLPESERKTFIKVLSNVIEFYLESKIEKEIDDSFSKLFKF